MNSGIYLENVLVTQNVTLRGHNTGGGLPEINSGGAGSAVTLLSNGTTIEGFNLTKSEHCGCGDAGISAQSSNNTISGNIIYENKYGVYIRQGKNNTIISNDFIDNNIIGYDSGENHWNGTIKREGWQRFIQFIIGQAISGNYYSDYDEPKEGCNDTNKDDFLRFA